MFWAQLTGKDYIKAENELKFISQLLCALHINSSNISHVCSFFSTTLIKILIKKKKITVKTAHASITTPHTHQFLSRSQKVSPTHQTTNNENITQERRSLGPRT